MWLVSARGLVFPALFVTLTLAIHVAFDACAFLVHLVLHARTALLEMESLWLSEGYMGNNAALRKPLTRHAAAH